MLVKLFTRLFIGSLFLLCTTGASAGVIYEGTRTDYHSGKPDVNLKISIGERDLRIDISGGGAPRFSLIKTRGALIAIDYATGRYTERHINPTTSEEQSAVRGLRSTARKQFSLGNYCEINEAWEDDRLTQEVCLTVVDRLPEHGLMERNVALISGWLERIAAASDPMTLLNLSLQAPAQQNGSALPMIIRQFDQGSAVSELRVSQVSQVNLPRDTFSVPRGFKLLPAKACAHDETSCVSMLTSSN